MRSIVSTTTPTAGSALSFVIVGLDGQISSWQNIFRLRRTKWSMELSLLRIQIATGPFERWFSEWSCPQGLLSNAQLTWQCITAEEKLPNALRHACSQRTFRGIVSSGDFSSCDLQIPYANGYPARCTASTMDGVNRP